MGRKPKKSKKKKPPKQLNVGQDCTFNQKPAKRNSRKLVRKSRPHLTREQMKEMEMRIQRIIDTNAKVISLNQNIDNTKIESGAYPESAPYSLKRNNNMSNRPFVKEKELDKNSDIQSNEVMIKKELDNNIDIQSNEAMVEKDLDNNMDIQLNEAMIEKELDIIMGINSSEALVKKELDNNMDIQSNEAMVEKKLDIIMCIKSNGAIVKKELDNNMDIQSNEAMAEKKLHNNNYIQLNEAMVEKELDIIMDIQSYEAMVEKELENNMDIKTNEATINATNFEKTDFGDQRNESINDIELEEGNENGNKTDEESMDNDYSSEEEEMYECSCSRVFVDLEKYNKHKLKCRTVDSDFEISENDSSDPEIYECYCSKVFVKLGKYEKHKLKCKKTMEDFEVSENESSDSEDAFYPCYRCDQVYKNSDDLKKHKDACHPDDSEEYADGVLEPNEEFGAPIETDKIARTITIGWINNKGEIIKDKSVIYKKITKCNECGFYLRGRTSYVIHQLKHENDRAGISYECKSCQEIFKCEPELQMHENIVHCAEHLPFKCHHCGEKFLTLVATDSHMLFTHDDNSKRFPYKCYECSDVFINKNKFVRHMISHQTSKKTIECKICKGRFYAGAFYNRHMHVHTKYLCEICGKFYTRRGFQRHMLTHDEVKRHECPICNRRFAQQYNRKKHMRVHSGKKPYECEICKTRFNHNVSLKTHKKRTHNIDWWAENGFEKHKKTSGNTPIWKSLRKLGKNARQEFS